MTCRLGQLTHHHPPCCTICRFNVHLMSRRLLLIEWSVAFLSATQSVVLAYRATY